jgi:hypothetical protein
LFILTLIFILATNYSCIKKISVERNYRKNNGSLLILGLASSFNAWGDKLDTSDAYYRSKKCINQFGNIDSEEGNRKIREASKNNIILNVRAVGKKTIFINECILLKDIKVLYLTYNTFFSNTKRLIRISLYDDSGNLIAKEPSFTDIKSGMLIRNSENYFWGINFDLYEKLILNVKVYSAQGEYLYEYDQLLYGM